MTATKRTQLLKTWPEYWQAIADGTKTFEIRRDDRGFRVGDELALLEWDAATGKHTGRTLHRTVSYVLSDAERFGLQQGFVVLGLEGDPSIPTPVEITEEMMERAARSLANKIDLAMPVPSYLRQYARDALEAALAVRPMVEAGPAVGITPDMHARGVKALTEPSKDVYSVRALDQAVAEQVVTQVLGAALAGLTVVQLPTPDKGVLRASARTIVGKVDEQSRPFVRLDGQLWLVGEAEEVGLALVAAAREARRLAAESSEPCCDLHGEHCEPPADLCCTDCSTGVLPWTGQVTT